MDDGVFRKCLESALEQADKCDRLRRQGNDIMLAEGIASLIAYLSGVLAGIEEEE